MNKEEILAKSREENKDKDLYAIEVMKKGSYIDILTAIITISILFVTEILVCGSTNYGLWAILTAINSSSNLYRGIKLKEKSKIIMGIIWAVATILLMIATFKTLFETSTIL